MVGGGVDLGADSVDVYCEESGNIYGGPVEGVVVDHSVGVRYD